MRGQDPLMRWLIMLVLITVTELIFLLPFGLPRVFRPTFLSVFEIDNFELGLAQSAYGTVALIAYLCGGPVADRFPARRLMAMAMATTALGGVALLFVGSLRDLQLLYGFWGVATILLFWAAAIRAMREWGGAHGQGRAFGLFESGRGLFAALMATGLVALFSQRLGAEPELASLAKRTAALEAVIMVLTACTFVSAGVILLLIPERDVGAQPPARGFELRGLRLALRNPSVWLQALILICAYVGYKSIDDVALFASDAFGYDDVEAAALSTLTFWVRPLAAIGAGFLADRLVTSKVVLLGFAVMLVGSLGLALELLPLELPWVLVMTLAVSCVGVFSLRGVYFALFDEGRVPLMYTGSAVGLLSLVGYTPDIFMGPLMGYLTENSPGALGHRYLYAMVASFAALGLLASVAFRRVAALSASEA